MSLLSTFNSAGIKSVQRVSSAYIPGIGFTAGAGEDAFYKDFTISSVDVNKSVVKFNSTQYIQTCRLTSATNVRISGSGGGASWGGTITITEFY